MGSKSVNYLIIILGTLSAVAFMFLTYEGFQQKIISKHFSMKKIDTDDAKITIFLKFGLYFALYSIVLKVLKWILSAFYKFKRYAATIQRILLNSYDYFIIFSLILFYLIRNKTDWNFKQKAPLFGFWFISGRIIYAFGYLLTTLTDLNLKVPGVAMIYGLISFMIAEALGCNGFKVFQMIDPLIPQL